MRGISSFEAHIQTLKSPDVRIARRKDEFVGMVNSGMQVVIWERPPIDRDWKRSLVALQEEGAITPLFSGESHGMRWMNRMGRRPKRWPRWKKTIDSVKDRYAKNSLSILHGKLEEVRDMFPNRIPFLLTIEFAKPYKRDREPAHTDFDSVGTSNLSTKLLVRSKNGRRWIQPPPWSLYSFTEDVKHEEPKNSLVDPRVLAIEQFDPMYEE